MCGSGPHPELRLCISPSCNILPANPTTWRGGGLSLFKNSKPGGLYKSGVGQSEAKVHALGTWSASGISAEEEQHGHHLCSAYEVARPHGASYLHRALYLETELTFQPQSKRWPPWLPLSLAAH